MNQQTSTNTVLVVDDNANNLQLLFDVLHSAHYNVLIAQDGPSALTSLQQVRPDLILLDIMMPEMNGFELYQRLRQQPIARDVPVIFLSALSDTETIVQGLRLNAVDYITKPFQAEEVLARVEKHLTLARLQRELEIKNARLELEIAERRKIEQELRQQRRLAEEHNKELDAFARTVAHDIKNPLGIIVTYSNFITEQFDSLEQAKLLELLKTMGQVGRKGANIVDELLLLAGVRKQTVSPRPLKMDRIVKQAWQRLAFMIDEYEGQLIIPESWPAAIGYGSWVEEVWVNYLSNGLKYGGSPPRLELGADIQPDGFIRFWVLDNGPGLSPAEQARLFTEFTRLDEVRAQGHGLGLSIVRRIVEKLGGAVGVESELGAGSRFYFTLPPA